MMTPGTFRFPRTSPQRMRSTSLPQERVYKLPTVKEKPGGARLESRPEKYPVMREPQINPDTGELFLDPRSRITKSGRVICEGADYDRLRERVAAREAEICQRCGAWAQAHPEEGTGLWPGNLHHVKGRGAAKRNDINTREETEWLCGGPQGCHEAHHRGPKPCPPKPRAEDLVVGA